MDDLRPGMHSVMRRRRATALTVDEEVGTGFDVGAIASEEWKEQRREELKAEKARDERRASMATRRGTTVVAGLVALLVVGLVVAAVLITSPMPVAAPFVAQVRDADAERLFAHAVIKLVGGALCALGTVGVYLWDRY